MIKGFAPMIREAILTNRMPPSAQNRANPDSTQIVRWGDQTFEEMGLGFFRYRFLGEDEFHRLIRR